MNEVQAMVWFCHLIFYPPVSHSSEKFKNGQIYIYITVQVCRFLTFIFLIFSTVFPNYFQKDIYCRACNM